MAANAEMSAGVPQFRAMAVVPTRRKRLVLFLLYWLDKALLRNPAKHLAPLPFLVADNDNFRQMTFTFAVIALAAQLARVDGKVKKEEFAAFCELFPMPFEEQLKIHTLFVMAAKERPDVNRYAQQIVQLFPGRAGLMQELFTRLCKLAAADGGIKAPENAMLLQIAAALQVEAVAIGSVAVPFLPPPGSDPYTLLGVSPKTSNDAIKQAYRARIRELHPDRFTAAGHAAPDIAAAQAGLAAVNEAYRTIAKKRRIK